jgi:hypothetical protein
LDQVYHESGRSCRKRPDAGFETGLRFIGPSLLVGDGHLLRPSGENVGVEINRQIEAHIVVAGGTGDLLDRPSSGDEKP